MRCAVANRAYGASGAFRIPPVFRSAGACPPRSFPRLRSRRRFVVRGPVPRNRSQPRVRWRGTGPRPTGCPWRFVALRRFVALWGFVTLRCFVARGPVPRDRSQPRLFLCRLRSPDRNRYSFRDLAIPNYRGRRGTGPRPTVLAVHFAEVGEGQALALRR